MEKRIDAPDLNAAHEADIRPSNTRDTENTSVGASDLEASGDGREQLGVPVHYDSDRDLASVEAHARERGETSGGSKDQTQRRTTMPDDRDQIDSHLKNMDRDDPYKDDTIHPSDDPVPERGDFIEGAPIDRGQLDESKPENQGKGVDVDRIQAQRANAEGEKVGDRKEF